MSAVLASRPRVVPMQLCDLDEVIVVEREVYDFPWTPGNFRDSIGAGYACRVYRSETDALIGYGVLMMGVDEAHLLNISIAAPFQHNGYGSRLLEHFIDLVKHQKMSTLCLEVRPSNEAARHLYVRRGFRQVGLRRGYYPANAGREDALVLTLSL